MKPVRIYAISPFAPVKGHTVRPAYCMKIRVIRVIRVL
jgi:hypothetical protein